MAEREQVSAPETEPLGAQADLPPHSRKKRA